jgi:hypothetical protein
VNRRLVVVALVSLSACYIDPQGSPPAMGPPPQGGFGPVAQGGPPPGGGGMAAGGPIEAGCSYSGNQLPGDIGGVFQVSCPAGCEMQGGLWGSDVYTADSGICRAGIHAGLITPAGGVVSVRLEPGRPAYRGSVRYGVQSSDYGQYPKSYTLFPAAGGQAAGPTPQPGPYAQPAPAAYPAAPPPPPPPASYPPPQPAGYAPPPAGPAIEAGCSYSANQIRGEIGTTVMVNCPPGCSNSGGLWGTDAYTADSGICRAAIHAGIISDRGGNVFVTLDPGRPAYRGSFRNGVRSSDYGNYPKSYHLSRP